MGDTECYNEYNACKNKLMVHWVAIKTVAQSEENVESNKQKDHPFRPASLKIKSRLVVKNEPKTHRAHVDHRQFIGELCFVQEGSMECKAPYTNQCHADIANEVSLR